MFPGIAIFDAGVDMDSGFALSARPGMTENEMKLSDLVTEAARDPRLGALAISGITADSRKVKKGDLFVAVPGTKADGSQFVAQALANGAAAAIAEKAPDGLSPDAPFVKISNARLALARAAAKIFPRQPQTIAAITGTSGKTSIAAFTRQIWSMLGQPAASIGTVGVVSPKREVYGSLTTPDPVALHGTLDELAGEGVTHLALEASSHGLDQFRLDGVRVSAGAFTNLSRDHLDYHPDLKAYLAAKLRLFSELLQPGQPAVIVTGHDGSDAVTAASRTRKLDVFTVGRDGNGIKLVDVAINGYAQSLTLEYAGRKYNVALPLVGAFQVENALTAAGLAITTGSDPARVFESLQKLHGAGGRLERAGERNGAPIFIDYAHKPDALSKALEALRPYVKGELVVVFGAGGDRDPGKRSMMGAIAAKMADRVIVTDDNPRSENPAAIRAAILKAAPSATEIGDRGEAIRASIATLKPGDVLLIAGKGHESGQIVGDRVLPFSDHQAVAEALREKVR
jgi:UDP-N-acetylmuramoyl-L-alanyl-D-glutamate--2,6-diaminopimelate ligase